MRVAIDIDNTLLDWQARWAELYKQWWGRYVPLAVTSRWDGCLSGTKFTSMDEFYEWFTAAGGWTTMEWIHGAQGAIWDLKRAGHELMLVTSRPVAGEASARELASALGLPLYFYGNKDKHRAPADLWIDDAPEVLENLAANNCKAIVFDQPWNDGLDGDPYHQVAFGWDEVVELVAHLAEEDK